MIEIEVVQEIWRTSTATFVVVYPFPEMAIIKGLRGSYSKGLREEIKQIMKFKNIKEVIYERFKGDKFHRYKLKVK